MKKKTTKEAAAMTAINVKMFNITERTFEAE
jgi:hypothetical protein